MLLTVVLSLSARNRFSLRGQQTPSTEKAETVAADDKDNAIETTASSTTARPRLRPTFNIRSRGRLTPSTTAAPAEEDQNEEETKETEKVTSAAPAAKSRLSLARPANRLLPRPRPNILSRGSTTTAAPEQSSPDAAPEEDLEETDVPSEVNERLEEPEKIVSNFLLMVLLMV